MTISVVPAGTLKVRPPFTVVLLDVSPGGVGIITSRALVAGSRFRMTLDLGPDGGGLIYPHYAVRNCVQVADGVFKVGAEFTGQVDGNALKLTWSADEVAAAVGRLH